MTEWVFSIWGTKTGVQVQVPALLLTHGVALGKLLPLFVKWESWASLSLRSLPVL